jgi:hypothetical protein
MEENPVPALGRICQELADHRLPRWEELPDLELYMDQVLALITRYLGSYPGYDQKGLTASMVNNYVKLGVMPAPVKKKYTRTHLAHLIAICILKSAMPIAAVQQLIAQQKTVMDEQQIYDRFCQMFEQTNQAVAQSAQKEEAPPAESALVSALCYAALRAQAEQALASQLLESLTKNQE